MDKSSEAQFLDCCALSRQEMKKLAGGTAEERKKVLRSIRSVTPQMVLRKQPMKWWEELSVVLFLAFVIPNAAITIPATTFLIGKFYLDDVLLAFEVLAIILIPLTILPQSFQPESLHSWMAHQVVRYFSFRFIMEHPPPSLEEKHSTPRILVAPPHGVFPYGNLLSMIVHPSMTGYCFHGLAATLAVVLPLHR